MMTNYKKSVVRVVAADQGFSLLELAIAILLLGLLVGAWLQTVTSTIRNDLFLQKLGDVNALSSDKAGQLIKQADQLAQMIPSDQLSIGAIAPNDPVPGFFDTLDENGNVIGGVPDKRLGPHGLLGDGQDGGPKGGDKGSSPVVKFIRQWLIVREPDSKDITVYVSLVYKDSNQITRIARAARVDGLIVRD
ncbi:MAG: prepilin-type N-terminal cleavage/methylation domain-containing protein [Acidobacteriota bacterium]